MSDVSSVSRFQSEPHSLRHVLPSKTQTSHKNRRKTETSWGWAGIWTLMPETYALVAFTSYNCTTKSTPFSPRSSIVPFSTCTQDRASFPEISLGFIGLIIMIMSAKIRARTCNEMYPEASSSCSCEETDLWPPLWRRTNARRPSTWWVIAAEWTGHSRQEVVLN